MYSCGFCEMWCVVRVVNVCHNKIVFNDIDNNRA